MNNMLIIRYFCVYQLFGLYINELSKKIVYNKKEVFVNRFK